MNSITFVNYISILQAPSISLGSDKRQGNTPDFNALDQSVEYSQFFIVVAPVASNACHQAPAETVACGFWIGDGFPPGLLGCSRRAEAQLLDALHFR